MSAEAVDYFSNHRHKLRFPWSLYHRPIVEELALVLRSFPGKRVLNVGAGPFLELESLGQTNKRFTLCDVDSRAVDLAKRIHGSAVERAEVVVPGGPLPFAEASFDAVVSMDVVEHVIEPLSWVKETLRVLTPGGLLFLTTPNYGSTSLRLIESTVLEAIARVQGFSRRALHPTKLDRARLSRLLADAGLSAPLVKSLSFGWVIAATGTKSAARP